MIVSLQLLVNDWVNATFVSHGDYCEHYPVQCSDDAIRLYGYKIATIYDDHVLFHQCQWTRSPNRRDIVIYAGDPKFFNKLKRRIKRRIKFGVA